MEPLCFSGLNHRPAVSWCSYTYRTRTGFRLITRVNYRIGDGSACADQLIRIGSVFYRRCARARVPPSDMEVIYREPRVLSPDDERLV